MRKILLTAALAAIVPMLPAAATATKAARGGDMPYCMQEQVNVSINFNFQVGSPKEAKETFDARLRDIDAFVKQANLKKWELQSMNYSVSAQNNGYGDTNYQLSGSASYQTDNADQAFALMDQLTKQKLYVNVNVSKYRNNGMPCPASGAAE